LRKGLLYLSIVLLLLVNFLPHVEPTMALNTSQELLDQAPYVLTGYVTKIESQWDTQKTNICSDVTIIVEEALRGTEIDNQIVIRHLGGEVEGLGQIVSHEPRFMLGERVKVYLTQWEDGKFSVVAGDRGKTSLSVRQNSGSEVMNEKQIICQKTMSSLDSSPVYFSYSGIHWSNSIMPIRYYINQNGTADCTGEFEAVQNSFQTWEDDTGSYIDYTYMGTTTRQGDTYDGYNVVSWGSLNPGTGAQCTIWYNESTLLIIECDLVFNDYYTWSSTGETGKLDIQDIGTHEAGHSLMLDDLYSPECSELTMYGYAEFGETKKRTLEAGDIAGIRFIYPVSSSSATIYPEADSYVDSEYPTLNYGGSSYLYVRNTYDSVYRISYIRFNFTSIPSGAVIQSAVLQVYNLYLCSASTKIGVHQSSNTTWSEFGIIWNNKPTYESLSVSNQTVVTANCSYTWDITSIVQSSISSGKLTAVLKTEATGNLNISFYSGDHGSATERPRLSVMYVVPYRAINLRTRDWSGNILPSVTVEVGANSKISDSNGWANFMVLSGQTYSVTARWGGIKVNQTSIALGSSNITENLRCHVWNLTVNVKDSSGTLLPAKGTRLLITLPNSTHINLTDVNSASYKVMNGTFYFAIKWQNSWVYGNLSVPLDTVNSTQNLLSKVYRVSLSSFRDSDGNALYYNPSSFKVTFPNGTTSVPLSVGSYLIQNGTTTWHSIIWQGSNIVPSAPTSFDATNGNPSVNTRVYPLKLKNKEHLGNLFTQNVILTFPNTTSLTKTPSSGWINLTQVQNGTIILGSPAVISNTERCV